MFDLTNNVIIGHGLTAVYTASYLEKHQYPFSVWTDGSVSLPPVLEPHRCIQLPQYTTAWISPGLPLDHPLTRGIERGILDVDYFLANTTSKVILVTGTNGKSTVCYNLKQQLEIQGFTADIYGNYQPGILSQLDRVVDWVIIELSSFQLARLKYGYRVAGVLLLNITRDHLDWHASYDSYIDCKKKILSYSDVQCVYNDEFGGESFIDLAHHWHQYYCWQHSVNISAIQKILEMLDLTYHEQALLHLPFRQEKIVFGDKIIINDSKSTNLASSVSALQAVYQTYPGHRVLLLLGGINKSGSIEPLTESLLPGTRVVVIGDHFEGIQDRVSQISELEDTLRQFNGVVLFSPGGSSYDQYTDYEERGRSFRSFIECL